MSGVVGIVIGIIFAGLGGMLLLKLKSLTSSPYYRILFIVIAVLLFGFAIYIGWRSIYLYE